MPILYITPMRLCLFIFFSFMIACASTGAQDSPAGTKVDSPEWFGLRHISDYLNLKPDDIGFRSDYTDPDSFRLKVVADLMLKPLEMIDYSTSLKNGHVIGHPEIISRILYTDLLGEHQTGRSSPYKLTSKELSERYNLFYTHLQLNSLLTRASKYLGVIFPKSTDAALGRLSASQKKFLLNQFKDIITMSTDEEKLGVAALDSLEKLEESYAERFVQFGYLFDRDPIVAAGTDCLQELMPEILGLRKDIKDGKVSIADLIKSAAILPKKFDAESYLGKQSGWAVGGQGTDTYTGNYSFIIDFGGDDNYNLSYDPGKPHGCIIIDFGGDDNYRSLTDFTIASGCLSAGILLDFEGNDRYDAKSFGLGSGYFGYGILYDPAGDDRYDGDTHVEGAGTFGLGLLIDEGGRDIYNAAVFSQGFGFIDGIGMIYEMDGSDSYYAGGKYKDFLRYEDRYLSMSQGFGYGLRPWMSGGIGAIVDLKGSDSYSSDIAQACSYWWSLGVIYDSSGNDNYQCYQYGQGAATHMTLGILVDGLGNDVYFGKGLMQGCGHDYSCGILLDRQGDDVYTAHDLSQAAGSANGAGLLIDNGGNDRYLIKNPDNTHGYGNPRRDFGSIGLFIDLGGLDQYVGYGRDNFYWRTNSQWGGGMDIEMIAPDSTQANK